MNITIATIGLIISLIPLFSNTIMTIQGFTQDSGIFITINFVLTIIAFIISIVELIKADKVIKFLSIITLIFSIIGILFFIYLFFNASYPI